MTQSTSRCPALLAAFAIALIGIPANATTFPTQTSEYHGSACQFIQSLSSGYSPDFSAAGMLLTRSTSPATAAFVCPGTVITTASPLYVANISFAMDAVLLPTGSPAVVSCDGTLETANGAKAITPGAHGVDATEYPGVNRIYYSCVVQASAQDPPSTVSLRVNGYKIFMSLYTK